MKSLFTILLLMMLSLPAAAKEPIRTFECMVEKITDGDTIRCVKQPATTVGFQEATAKKV